jgi:hypothetical protein
MVIEKFILFFYLLDPASYVFTSNRWNHINGFILFQSFTQN